MSIQNKQPSINSLNRNHNNQLVLYDYNDKYDNQTNSLAITEMDLFVKFGKYLNDSFGFKTFNQYFLICKKFKNDLNLILLDYYEDLDFNDVDNQMVNLKKLIILIDNLQFNIMDLNIHSDKYYNNRFSNYFRISKSNINDLDPEHFQSTISKVQFDWTIKIKNMENLYNQLFNKNTEITKHKNILMSGFHKMIKYFNNDDKINNYEVNHQSTENLLLPLND